MKQMDKEAMEAKEKLASLEADIQEKAKRQQDSIMKTRLQCQLQHDH